MIGGPFVFPAYVAIKLAAYCGWSWIGLRLLAPTRRPRAGWALGLGTTRLLMGLVFGVVIWFAASLVLAVTVKATDYSSRWMAQAFTYLVVYVPVRWMEWGLIELAFGTGSWRSFAVGSGRLARRWRLGGIVVSCLADIPVLLSVGGLPLGRFMC